MAPFGFMTVGANLLAKSLGLFSSAATVRCCCVAPAVKHFSAAAGGPPKRPMTAYMRFVKEQQPIVVREYPEVKPVDVVRKIAQQWRNLTPEQKQPFEEASLEAKEQYKTDMKKYQAQLTPAESAAIANEKRQKLARRRAIRKKRELANLGKPKRPRTAFNIFMAEHFEEATGSTASGKLKSMMDDWHRFSASQKQVYVQLAEDDKVRYKNEMKAWEEHMIELGREDLIRHKETRRKKATTTKKKSKVKVIKAKDPSKEAMGKKTTARSTAKKTESSTKK